VCGIGCRRPIRRGRLSAVYRAPARAREGSLLAESIIQAESGGQASKQTPSPGVLAQVCAWGTRARSSRRKKRNSPSAFGVLVVTLLKILTSTRNLRIEWKG